MRPTRDAAVEYAKTFLGDFYTWGGDDPSGFDCSGLVVEILKAVGVLPRGGDWSAAGLLQILVADNKTSPQTLVPGVLVFYREQGRVVHVEMVVETLADHTRLAIGASGGGPFVKTREDAIAANAFVKLRPVRAGWSDAIDPFA